MGSNPYYRNGSGYSDRTAGDALSRIAREERRKDLKKKSCRRTAEENRTHEEAVRIRKMTDAQLVAEIQRMGEMERKTGYAAGRKDGKPDIRAILEKISLVKGIGKKKLEAIEEILVNELGG